MEFIESKNCLVIFSKRVGLETAAKRLAELNGSQIRGFFDNREFKVPRKLNAMALVGALNQSIKRLDSHSLSKEGFTKLESYLSFTEFQLESLFCKIGNNQDFFTYRYNLWLLLLRNFEVLNLQDGEVQYLINLRKLKATDYAEFFSELNKVTVDQEGDFDACPKYQLENTLQVSFSSEEIRQLATKYEISIPNRLKKEEFLNYVKMFLEAKGKLDDNLAEQLANMTVVQLNTFCQLHKFTLSASLKREELIYLFLFLINKAGFEVAPACELVSFPFSKHLIFKIDFDAIDAFGRGEPKKVIYWDDDADELSGLTIDEETGDLDELLTENEDKQHIVGVIVPKPVTEEPKEEVKEEAEEEEEEALASDHTVEETVDEPLETTEEAVEETACEPLAEVDAKPLEDPVEDSVSAEVEQEIVEEDNQKTVLEEENELKNVMPQKNPYFRNKKVASK